MAKYEILRKEVDMAGKLRAWIDTGDEVQIFKFQTSPNKKEIVKVVDGLLKSKEIDKVSELERIKTQIVELDERKKQLEEETIRI